MIGAVLDHLWQSTLFAVLAGLLVLVLRDNGARLRFGLWFAASIKFLIPFVALATLGRFLPAPSVSDTAVPDIFLMQPAAQPFTAPALAPVLQSAAAAPGLDWPLLVLALWTAGFVAITARWIMRWFRLRSVLRAAVDLPLPAPVPVKSAPSLMEPGLVGIWQPVILLPAGIAERMSADELAAILAHELCHLRRRDNLTAAIHMLVEALFWFFPPVWWLGARLNEERERACDESVLAAGTAPRLYAESILKVCKHYLASPLPCAAGISGAGLKARIGRIAKNNMPIRLDGYRKGILTAGAFVVVAVPICVGAALGQAEAQNGLGPLNDYEFGMTPEQVRLVPGLSWFGPTENNMSSQTPVKVGDKSFYLNLIFDGERKLSNMELVDFGELGSEKECEKVYQTVLPELQARYGAFVPAGDNRAFQYLIGRRELENSNKIVPNHNIQYRYVANLSGQSVYLIQAEADHEGPAGRVSAAMSGTGPGLDKIDCDLFVQIAPVNSDK